jgi:hypothetical protein
MSFEGLKELQRHGLSIPAISKLTGWDSKPIRKYLPATKCLAGVRTAASAGPIRKMRAGVVASRVFRTFAEGSLWL